MSEIATQLTEAEDAIKAARKALAEYRDSGDWSELSKAEAALSRYADKHAKMKGKKV